MATGQHIFLSYRSVEMDFALKLAADLKNAGVKLWMDRLDGIQIGMDWRDAIEQAINNCAGMISVLSPDYVTSEYCRKEINRANALKRPIFPVLLRRLKAEAVPFVIEGVQYEDFTNWLNEKEYETRFDKLLARLKAEATNQIGDEPDAEIRYLTSLIAELESRRGVLEYVELRAEADAPAERPEPPIDDEWGFAELIGEPKESTPKKIQMSGISEALEKHPCFVLIGEPGAGKTTTIRRLARDAARKRLENPRTTPLPLLLYLPQWNEEVTALDFVRSKYPFAHDPEGMLKSGEILLYLDGLNEMGSKGNERAKSISTWINSSNAPQRLIVTCRAGDYEGDLNLGKIPIVLVEELNKEQITQFAKSYLKEKTSMFLEQVVPDTADSKKHDNRSLFHLACNPYMLSALILLYGHSSTGGLPRNTGLLFDRLAKALWKREEHRGKINRITFEEIERVLGHLAFVMIDQDMPVDVPLSWTIEVIRSFTVDFHRDYISMLLNIAQSASYISITGENLRFYHQLLQEFFAATKLIGQGLDGIISRSNLGLFNQQGSKWDNVVIALSGIEDSDGAMLFLVNENPYLAVKCLQSGITVDDSIRRTLVNNLVIALEQQASFVRKVAFESLSYIQEPFMHPELLRAKYARRTPDFQDACVDLESIVTEQDTPLFLDLLDHKSAYIRRSAARILGKIGNDMAVEKLESKLRDTSRDFFSRERVCDAVAHALVRIGTEKAVMIVGNWKNTGQN